MPVQISYQRVLPWLCFASSVVLMMFPALYNGFPIVTSDSGAYIYNGFAIYIPADRPLAYSIFIRLSSLSLTLWGVVAAQAIMLVWLMQLIIKHFMNSRYHPILLPAMSLFVCLGTSGAWFCSQLMPDIITAHLLLALIVWFMVPLRGWLARAVLLTAIWGFMIMHNAHLITALVASGLMALWYLAHKHKTMLRRSLVIVAVSIAGFITLSAMNYISGKGFRPSSATHVFMMCRMVENGIMDRFLAEHCHTGQEYKLCAYRDKLPLRQWDFQWNEDSPLYLTGGWEANEEEYNKIIGQTLRSPKYLGMHLFKSAQASLRQLTQIQIGDGFWPQLQNSNPYWKVSEYYGHELKEYAASLQNTGNLKTGFFNALIVLCAFGLPLWALLLSIRQERLAPLSERIVWRRLFFITILFILVQAAATATFSTVVARLHARVFWVLPLLCALYILQQLMPPRREA